MERERRHTEVRIVGDKPERRDRVKARTEERILQLVGSSSRVRSDPRKGRGKKGGEVVSFAALVDVGIEASRHRIRPLGERRLNLGGCLDDVNTNDARAGDEAVGDLNPLACGSADCRIAAFGNAGACLDELEASRERGRHEDLPLLAMRTGSWTPRITSVLSRTAQRIVSEVQGQGQRERTHWGGSSRLSQARSRGPRANHCTSSSVSRSSKSTEK